MACHPTPFHRATDDDGLLPAVENAPPTIRSGPLTVIEYTETSVPVGPVTPAPIACHPPFNRPMQFTAPPPMVLTPPPATSDPLCTASANTAPFVPLPIPPQEKPSQLARCDTLCPPATSK